MACMKLIESGDWISRGCGVNYFQRNRIQKMVISVVTLQHDEALEVAVVVSERELRFMFAICHRPSVCRLSVCLSVVCNVRAPYSDD